MRAAAEARATAVCSGSDAPVSGQESHLDPGSQASGSEGFCWAAPAPHRKQTLAPKWPSFLRHPSPARPASPARQHLVPSAGSRHSARTERSGNDVHLWHDSVPVANPAAAGPVQPHRVDLIHEGDGPELVGHVTQLLQRTHRACGDRAPSDGGPVSQQTERHVPGLSPTLPGSQAHWGLRAGKSQRRTTSNLPKPTHVHDDKP